MQKICNNRILQSKTIQKQVMTLVKEIIFTAVLFSIIPVAFAQEYPELGVKVETIAENLTIPWSIDWTLDGTIFFTERNGNLRVIENGVLVNDPILSLSVGGVEGGMLGVTVDPNYSLELFVVFCHHWFGGFLFHPDYLLKCKEIHLVLLLHLLVFQIHFGIIFHGKLPCYFANQSQSYANDFL